MKQKARVETPFFLPYASFFRQIPREPTMLPVTELAFYPHHLMQKVSLVSPQNYLVCPPRHLIYGLNFAILIQRVNSNGGQTELFLLNRHCGAPGPFPWGIPSISVTLYLARLAFLSFFLSFFPFFLPRREVRQQQQQ
jgi:hypothetical protein